MDETRKAVSVGQLQELHAGYDERLKTVEAGAKSQGDASATIAALSGQLVVLQQTVQDMRQELADEEDPEPVDLMPIIAAIQALAAQITTLTEIVLRPLTRTGEAILPDGGRVQLQVSETRN